MTQHILLSARDLRETRLRSQCVIVDCRFRLDDPGAGYKSFLEAHIPGAVYSHLDDDLSSPVTAGSGRHPLPDAEKFAAFLSRSGWQPGLKMVAYDDVGGAIAARLWWLMKYFGHDGACMLDGGISAWQAAGYKLGSGRVATIPTPLVEFTVRNELLMSTSDVAEGLEANDMVLVDARARERFTGEVEPLDTVAGHIPGSVNYPYSSNLDQNGLFKTPGQILDGMKTLAVDNEAGGFVHTCGSGVTACHNIFAAELAGIKGSKLYAGSWSEWIRDKGRPVETLRR